MTNRQRQTEVRPSSYGTGNQILLCKLDIHYHVLTHTYISMFYKLDIHYEVLTYISMFYKLDIHYEVLTYISMFCKLDILYAVHKHIH